MTVFSGQTENAGHFLQVATMAIGHKVIALLLRWMFAHRADHDVLPCAIVSVSRRAYNASNPEERFFRAGSFVGCRCLASAASSNAHVHPPERPNRREFGALGPSAQNVSDIADGPSQVCSESLLYRSLFARPIKRNEFLGSLWVSSV